MYIPIQTRGENGWTRRRLALVDTGAANAVLPGACGKLGCRVAFAEIAGERYWGETRFVDLRIQGTTCRAFVEAFVPLGRDPRRSTSWTSTRPRRLQPVGRLRAIVGRRFLEAIGATELPRETKRHEVERLACDPAHADPMVTLLVMAGTTVHFGFVCGGAP